MPWPRPHGWGYPASKPDPDFRGKFAETYKGSTPNYPRPAKPPRGSPNASLILLDDGTRDSTFSGDGLLSLAFSSATDQFEGVAIRPDAKIVAVGPAPTGTTGTPSTMYSSPATWAIPAPPARWLPYRQEIDYKYRFGIDGTSSLSISPRSQPG